MTRTVTVVVPAFNEGEAIRAFHERLSQALEPLDEGWTVLYVDDGSTDDTVSHLADLRERDNRVGLMRLSRNFGKEIAITAGLDHAEGDAVIVMDADLQDPPELVPNLVAEWRDGWDVVYGRRSAREGDSLTKRFTAHGFYRLMRRVSDTAIPEDVGDFRLMDRRVVDALGQLRERNRFMKGLFSWVGFRQREVPYRREARHAGRSKWSYWRLWNYALDGITSFTVAPLKIATYLGLLTALGAFVYGSWIIVKTLVYGADVPGYPSLMVVILFLGGIQLIALGIIGEYLGRLFMESKQRPLYLIDRFEAPGSEKEASGETSRRDAETQS
jgi:glycosyltransferase involved in cell wall biosynthesis